MITQWNSLKLFQLICFYLIEKYKEAKEWNQKQTGGTRRQSIFHNEIDTILGCRDIITLQNVSKAGTSGRSSPLNTSHSSGVDSPAGSKEKDACNARTDRKKQSKQSRKRNQAAVEEGEEKERRQVKVWMPSKNVENI